MKKIILKTGRMNKLFAAIMIVFITSCTNVENFKKLNSAPQNTEFNKDLAKEYQQYSYNLAKNFQFSDAFYFKNKGKQAISGGVLPEDLSKWQLPEHEEQNLIWASNRFSTILTDDVKNTYPTRLARTQRLLDCWIRSVGHKASKDIIEECRMDFVLEISSLEALLIPFTAPIYNDEPINYNGGTVYFALNSDIVETDGIQTINEAIEAVENRANYVINITGYADNSGDKNYNFALATKRAAAVAEIFTNRAINQDYIKQNAVEAEAGPNKPAYDKTKRRVEISIEEKK